MVKVAFRYNPELVQWIKNSGSGSVWNREEKVWEVPEEILEGMRAKAKELGVELKAQQDQSTQRITQIQPESPSRQQEDKLGYLEYDSRFEGGRATSTTKELPAGAQKSGGLKEGEIRLRRSRDGRFVLISINLIAFSSDVEDLMKGTKSSVKFRVLPPPTPRQSDTE